MIKTMHEFTFEDLAVGDILTYGSTKYCITDIYKEHCRISLRYNNGTNELKELHYPNPNETFDTLIKKVINYRELIEKRLKNGR